MQTIYLNKKNSYKINLIGSFENEGKIYFITKIIKSEGSDALVHFISFDEIVSGMDSGKYTTMPLQPVKASSVDKLTVGCTEIGKSMFCDGYEAAIEALKNNNEDGIVLNKTQPKETYKDKNPRLQEIKRQSAQGIRILSELLGVDPSFIHVEEVDCPKCTK